MSFVAGERDVDRDRESIFRMRDRRWLDSTALRDEARLDRDRADGLVTESKKAASPSSSPLNFGEDLQYWCEKVRHVTSA